MTGPEAQDDLLARLKKKNFTAAVIGLGYVGLPLAVEFGRHYDTVGFDINAARVAELQSGRDSTLEASAS